MNKYALMLSASLSFASAGSAQDTPLQSILIEGEGWKPATDLPMPAPEALPTVKIPLVKAGPATLWRKGGTLVVADDSSRYLWTFKIESDGTLSSGANYYHLQVGRDVGKVSVTALTTDKLNRVYAATDRGIQVFDPTARLSGVFTNPSNEPITQMTFFGDKQDTLLVLAGRKTYIRKLNVEPPIAPKKK